MWHCLPDVVDADWRPACAVVGQRLRDEYGTGGGYTIVKDHVRGRRRQTQEMFLPLSHPRAAPSATSARSCWSSVGWSRKPTFSPWTCPTATGASSRPILPRPPRPSWTATCRRSHFWVECPRASSTTIPGWRWPGYLETVDANVPGPSLSCNPTTCSMTGSGVPPRVMTKARSRVWWATHDATSCCPSRPSKALRRSMPIWRSVARSGWTPGSGAMLRPLGSGWSGTWMLCRHYRQFLTMLATSRRGE